MRLRYPVACALLVVACGGDPAGEGQVRSAVERHQRLVLVTLDTLRLDAFDGPRAAMPEVRAWAERGRVFDRYYSVTSTTQPTHATLFTGLYPWEHGLTANSMVFARSHETVAEILSARGFETAAVVASFPLHGMFGFDQGFDYYANEFGKRGEVLSGEVEVERDGDLHSDGGRIQKRTLEILDEIEDGDQFLWFHYFDPHAPYGDSLGEDNPTVSPYSLHFPRRIFRRLERGFDLDETLTKVRELYDEDVRYLDQILAQLFARLEEDNDRFDTHIVVLSDHGEALGEGGSIGHGKRLLECLIRVPLFILSPRVEPGRVEAPVGTVDVATTLLVLAGVEDRFPHGRDLTGVLDPDQPVYGMRRTFEGPYEEERTDGLRHPLPSHQFFEFRSGGYYTGDGREIRLQESLTVLTEPSTVQPIRDRFTKFLDTLNGLELEAIEDPEVLKRLEALGYTQ